MKNLAFTHKDVSHSGHFMTYASPSRESFTYFASEASNTNMHPQLQTSVRVLGLPFFPDTNIFIVCTNSHSDSGKDSQFVEYHIAHHELVIHPNQFPHIHILFPI